MYKQLESIKAGKKFLFSDYRGNRFLVSEDMSRGTLEEEAIVVVYMI